MFGFLFIILVFVSILILLFIMYKRSSLQDKILVMNALGVNFILLFLFLGVFYDELELIIDIILFYAFTNFIGTIAFLKFMKEE